MKPETQLIRHVYVESQPAYIEIRPFPDAPECALEMRVTGDISEQWFGKMAITMSKQYAVELGKALMAAGYESQTILIP
jgi:hypothetical protein